MHTHRRARVSARYTYSHMRTIAIACLLLSLAAPAWALDEATVAPFDLPSDLTCEFAIFNQQNVRIATAYYRVLKETVDGRELYRFKYVGRNDQMSEAAEAWADPATGLPTRSTRKVVSGGNTFYQDVGYHNGSITLRSKYEGGQVNESQFPAAGNYYDYEELIWLVAQLRFNGAPQAYFNLFATITATTATVVISDLGMQEVEVQGKAYQAHAYSYEVNATPYTQWNVKQDGRWLPAKVVMGGSTFVNLSLDPKKQ